MLALDFPVLAAGQEDIVVDGTGGFWNPPATTETAGIVELATEEETIQGKDVSRAVTPKALKKSQEKLITYDAVAEQDGIHLVIDTREGVTFSEIQS